MGLQSKRSDGSQGNTADLKTRMQQADLCLQRGDLPGAETILKGVVKSTPEFLLAWSMLGWQYAVRGLLDEALRCYGRAYVINPGNPKVLLGLAKVQSRLGGRDAAIVTLQAARAAAPNDIEIELHLAELQSDDGELETALAGYERVLRADPTNITALFGTAYCHEEMSNNPATVAAYEAIVRCSVGKPEGRKALATAASKLARLRTSIADDKILSYLQTEEPRDLKIRALFAEAAIMRRQGRHEQAWKKLTYANKLVLEGRGAELRQEAEFRRKTLEFAQTYKIKSPQPIAASRSTPIYILGPSRSGKSQLEAVLAGDARVVRRFENVLFEKALTETAQLLGLPDGNQPWCVPDSGDQRLADVYHRRMAQLAPNAEYVTFSAPGNIGHVGRIASIDPAARFLFLKRNTDDLAFNIFAEQYSTGNLYSYDLSCLHDYLRWYDRMTEHWMAAIPGRCHLASYDQLAGGDARELEDISRFLGLDPARLTARVHDDRNCAQPYSRWMSDALGVQPS